MYIYLAQNRHWHFNTNTESGSAWAWTKKRDANEANGKCPAADNDWQFGTKNGKWIIRPASEFTVTSDARF